MRTFVLSDDKSNKFWNIDLQGTSFTVTFRKIGTKGQTQVKDFPDASAARKAHDKLVAEKLGKGYLETSVTPTPAPSPLQVALEAALTENPDDLAAHSAYADYLMEQDDPRGEFIQMQLALEDPGRTEAERLHLQERANELQTQHARQWMGDVGRFLVGDWSGEDKPFHYEFLRGWLDLVRVLPAPDAIIASLARSPEARLLRRLEVVYDMRYHPCDFDPFLDGPNKALKDDEDAGAVYDGVTNLAPLFASPHITNLRVFKVGFSDRAEQLANSMQVDSFWNFPVEQVIDLLAKCPRLEELHLNNNLSGVERLFALPTLGNLRVLQYYYGTIDTIGHVSDETYPLTALADNASLGRLTTLRLHPDRDSTIDIEEVDAVLRSPNLPSLTHLQVHMTTYGDEGCRRIIESGILRRLNTLDIGYGNMTDEGARLLAACPDLRHLDLLEVSRNALTPEGIATLQATGVRVIADDQDADGERDYLYEVDME